VGGVLGLWVGGGGVVSWVVSCSCVFGEGGVGGGGGGEGERDKKDAKEAALGPPGESAC